MQLPVGDHLGKEKKVKHKKGAHLLEVVGQQLAANVQPPHSAANPFALDEGDTVGETEARVNDQAAALVGKLFPVLKGFGCFIGKNKTDVQVPGSRKGQVHGF